jgi:hypothetical protein
LIGKENNMQVHKKPEHANFPLHPPLEELLTKLYHKVPRLNFESVHSGYVKGSEQVIYEVKVFNGNEMVGEIEVNYTTFRNQGKCDVYTISSPRIKNRITPRHAKVTKLSAEALKTAVKTFSPVSTATEIVTGLKGRIATEVGSVQYNAMRQAERLGEDHLLPLMELAMVVNNGGRAIINTELARMLSKNNLEKAINNARIATSVNNDFKNQSGIMIKEERDGSLLGVLLDTSLQDSSRVVTHRDTYGLPEIYQTKLAMLRILEQKQPVESIGVKFSIEDTNWYYLTGGEIITTS